ncbi:hypothetical protein [Rhodococcus qingshengii]|uniref:hypothetical protein n=1 Tax=Rhodococcus qingshengii TaxID=334542 RepID=UPI001C5CF3B6|nr:hypothetical protein [Rhodococcus qingshengii]MBW4818334.1 hypothetical protein [Rhodococcus qingshengii]
MDTSIHAHTSAAIPVNSTDFLAALHQQWIRESAMPSARIELSQWVSTRPELAGAESFSDLKALTFCEPDAVLSVLLHAHQAGSSLAGNTLIEFMRPKLAGMQKYARVANGVAAHAAYADRTAATLHAFWDTISTYRGAHRGIAGQLALNTLHKITATTTALDVTVGDTYFQIADEEKAAEEFLRAEDPTEIDVMEVLDWAVDQGTISASDRTLIMRSYMNEDGVDVAALAEEMGITYAVARKRLSRSIARVRDAVCDHLNVSEPKIKRISMYRSAKKNLSLAS